MRLADTRGQYVSMAGDAAMPLDKQTAEAQRMDDSIKEFEDELRELQAEGDRMQAQDPGFVLPPELSVLHSQWQDLHRLVSGFLPR